MVQSLNTKVDLVIDATAFTGLTDYGQIMIGDRGLNFTMPKIHVSLSKFRGKKSITCWLQ